MHMVTRRGRSGTLIVVSKSIAIKTVNSLGVKRDYFEKHKIDTHLRKLVKFAKRETKKKWNQNRTKKRKKKKTEKKKKEKNRKRKNKIKGTKEEISQTEKTIEEIQKGKRKNLYKMILLQINHVFYVELHFYKVIQSSIEK